MEDHKKKAAITSCLVGFFMATVTIAATPELAKLQDLKIVGHHFTTAISGGKHLIYVTEPVNGRYLVLKLSASLIGKSGKLFTDEFVLRYTHNDGKEDRSRCSAIGWAETGKPGDFKEFITGAKSLVRFNEGGEIFFGLAFYIEHDVESIELYRIGIAIPLTYRLGAYDRPFSVFVSTNRSAKLLADIEKTIRHGGYTVFSKQVLNPDKLGTTILYREKAETQAREISQRLMAQLGIVPELKRMNLASEVDVVIWAGKVEDSNVSANR